MIHDSCRTKRGCNIDIDPLAHDSVPIIIYSRMLRKRNDTKKVLSLFNRTLDKMAQKKRQMEKVLD